MDLRAFVPSPDVHDLSDVVVLEGEHVGKVMPAGLVRGIYPYAKVNEVVSAGDWIIPLAIHESQITVNRVESITLGLPAVTGRPGVVERWIQVTRDVSQDEGFQEWSLALREHVLLDAFAEQSAKRMWGHHFRLVLQGAGLELMPVRTLVHCQYSMRWGTRNSYSKLAAGMDQVMASLGHSLVYTKVKASGVVRLMNTEAECRCGYWRSIGLRETPGAAMDMGSTGGRAVVRDLTARLPLGAELVEVEVQSVRCAYCS